LLYRIRSRALVTPPRNRQRHAACLLRDNDHPVSKTVTYGLGLDLKNMSGQPAVSHGGTVDGYLSYLLYFPQQDIDVAVITNAFPVPTDHIPIIIAVAVGSAALGAL
jgi:hypothetical protein